MTLLHPSPSPGSCCPTCPAKWDIPDGWLRPPKGEDACRLLQAFDDLDQLIGAESLPSSELQQLASPNDDRGSFRRTRNCHASSSSELKQALIAQET